MKCLLLEDDIELNSTICEILTLDGYDIDTFYDGNKVLEVIDDTSYDLYIFDINVPNIDGLELLKYIKELSFESKVIIISSDNTPITIESAYKMGCYDYLKKPFALLEIRYKLKNIKERYFSNYTFDNGIVYNYNTNQLFSENNLIKLTRKELLLLNLLIQNRSRIVTKDMIIDIVYENQYTNDANLRALVKRLRGKLNNSEKFKTLIGIGFTII